MEYEVGKWYRLKTAYNWYAKFKCFIGDKWVHEENISIPKGTYEKQVGEEGWNNFRINGYSGTLLTDLSEIQKYLPEGHVDKITETMKNKDKFLKGDYIVCLNTPEKDSCFPRNYIFKQKYDSVYLSPEKNAESSTSGWAAVDFLGQGEYGKWRYATSEEIAEYNKLGKPYDVTTLATKKYDYEVVHCMTQEQWDFVTDKLNYTWTTGKWSSDIHNSCINLNINQHASTFFYKTKNYKIYSFDEWCNKKGYTVISKEELSNPEYVEYTNSNNWFKSDAKNSFEIGKIYKWDDLINRTIGGLQQHYWRNWTEEFKPSTKEAFDIQNNKSQEYQVGGWVRCIQDCIEVCKVGEYYQIDKIIDQTLIRVRVNNSTRYSTRDLFTTNYYKAECEWVGMKKPTDESIIGFGQTLLISGKNLLTAWGSKFNFTNNKPITETIKHNDGAALYTGGKLTGWEYSSLDNIKLKGIIEDLNCIEINHLDTNYPLDLSCFNKQKVSLLSLEDEPTVFNTNLKKIKKIKTKLLETN